MGWFFKICFIIDTQYLCIIKVFIFLKTIPKKPKHFFREYSNKNNKEIITYDNQNHTQDSVSDFEFCFKCKHCFCVCGLRHQTSLMVQDKVWLPKLLPSSRLLRWDLEGGENLCTGNWVRTGTPQWPRPFPPDGLAGASFTGALPSIAAAKFIIMKGNEFDHVVREQCQP